MTPAPYRGGKRVYAGAGRRHAAPAVDTSRSFGLRADHAAVTEGRTVFPGTVVGPLESPRMLVGGENNSKLGKRVTKGPWAGMPIYSLTLEERRTCPASCPVWSECFGNAMHYSRRHDALDEDFHLALWAEVVTLYRATMNERTAPPGLAIRLHVLGDFPSARYVAVWADLLDKLPALHVFGFTARRPDRDDDASRETFQAIEALTAAHWDRFAIRWSRDTAVPQGSLVVDEPSTDAAVVMCPAQTGRTASCASCGLCWAPAARHKTIGFLRHGRKARAPSGPPAVGSDAWWSARGH